MKRILICIITSCCLAGGVLARSEWKITSHTAKGDPQAGHSKAALCAACHGADGNSLNPEWPSLAGQNRHYLYRQLLAFKTGKSSGRFNAVMSPLVANLSEQDMWDLGAYYESLPAKVAKVKPEYLELGQRIYRGGNIEKHIVACIACHGPHGLGNPPAGFPRLSGQQPGYIIKQLHDYQQAARRNGTNEIMQTVAARMSDAEIDAVAHYVAGLH
jgi:cytochrome c553